MYKHKRNLALLMDCPYIWEVMSTICPHNNNFNRLSTSHGILINDITIQMIETLFILLVHLFTLLIHYCTAPWLYQTWCTCVL